MAAQMIFATMYVIGITRTALAWFRGG